MITPALDQRLRFCERRHFVQQAGYRLAHELEAIDRALVEEELALAAAVLEEADFYAALGLDGSLSLSKIAYQRWLEFCQTRATFTPVMLEQLTQFAHHKLKKADRSPTCRPLAP